MKHLLLPLLLIFVASSFSYSQSCNGSLTVTIKGSSTNLPLSAEEAHTDLTCNPENGSSNGTITVTPKGGSPPYTFDWSDISGTDDGKDRSNLDAGTYTVTVYDAEDCSVIVGPINLTEPEPIVIEEELKHLTCEEAQSGTADGSIEIRVSGGTGVYTYEWATTDGSGLEEGEQNQEGLGAGTYTVTVTDENGCATRAEFTITEPEPIVIEEKLKHLTCEEAQSGTADGGIEIRVSGGTGAYTYKWSTTDGSGLEESEQDQKEIGAGTYDVVVTDANGCTTKAEFVIKEPKPVVCNATSPTVGSGGTNILCNGGTGTIVVTGSGGTGAYEYSLDGGMFQSSGNFADVSAGAHMITVKDANGCSSTCSITLTEPTPLTAGSCNYVQDKCQLGAGEIKIEVGGGVAPYEVRWTATPIAPNTVAGSLDQPSPQTINSDGGSVIFTGADGNNQYQFVIVDSNGCQLE